jgi:hypothetical protein
MKFTVADGKGTTTTYEGGYTISDHGVLSVKPDHGNPVIFSPAGWSVLEVMGAPSS